MSAKQLTPEQRLEALERQLHTLHAKVIAQFGSVGRRLAAIELQLDEKPEATIRELIDG
jgi:hypothetical protein